MMLPENMKIVEAIKPQTTAGARSGDWVSLKGYRKCAIIVQVARGADATALAITVDKAKAVAGTDNSDGITMTHFWSNSDCVASDTLIKGTAAATIADDTTQSKDHIHVIDIDAVDLGEGYDCIQVEVGQSAAATLVSAVYVLYGARFAQATPPTAITD